jgi:cyclopropane fatty-acyl-phospholipid synthase-like methyltransferase
MLRKTINLFTNNVLINNIMIKLGLDAWLISKLGIYQSIRIDKTKTVTQMAGLSDTEEVMEARIKTVQDLKKLVKDKLQPGASLLDLGCGAGAYLKEFVDNYKCTGIDLHIDMIERGRENVPNAELIQADFLKLELTKKFDLIYSVSVLEFIPPSRIEKFLKKIYDSLNPRGYVFIHYPHALRKKDLNYPDLYYIEYSPSMVEKIAQKFFDIIEHKHGYDDRKVNDYDTQPYNPGERTYKNGYLLIARKK